MSSSIRNAAQSSSTNLRSADGGQQNRLKRKLFEYNQRNPTQTFRSRLYRRQNQLDCRGNVQSWEKKRKERENPRGRGGIREPEMAPPKKATWKS